MTQSTARKLGTIDQQAASFDRTRSDHKTEVAEDYVELIGDLLEAAGEARAVDLAARLGVSQATVNATIGRLQREGLVESAPYRSIFLTDSGRALAQACKRRHQVVLAFLKALGIDDETARIDTEGIEHHVSQTTLDAFERFLRQREMSTHN